MRKIHIPDGLLNPILTVLLWIVSVIVIIVGFYRISNSKFFREEESEKFIPYIGVIAAVVFAFQFVNYPVPGGTSGHLVGGTMVAVILGPWASVIVLFLVLVVQSFFGDGGFTALGANTFNMGIIGGIIGLFIVKSIVLLLKKTNLAKEIKITIATAIGSYLAVIIAATMCGLEIAVSGIIPIEYAVPSILYWHLLIGIGEAVISAMIVFYVYKTKPSLIITEELLEVI